MEVATALIEEAERLALHAQKRAENLQAELQEIEIRKATVESERDLARGAAKRLLNFQPSLGTDFQCPSCWIDRAQRARIYSIPGDNKVDRLRCETCRQIWEIPLDDR